MNEEQYEDAYSAPLPIDWNEWNRLYAAWRQHNKGRMARLSSYKGFGDKNFMADDVLGVWRIKHAGETVAVELSEVTFPDLTKPRSGERARFVGITYHTPEKGRWTPESGLAATLEDLERELFG
jgi:hypothetical protein